METNVVLVAPPHRAYDNVAPIGLMYMASYLEKEVENVRVDIIDLKYPSKTPISDISNSIVKNIKKLDPHIIGINCLTTDVDEVKSLSRKIKEEMGEVPIVVGGAHPTILPQDLLDKNKYIDYVVIGEGEHTFMELVQLLNGIFDQNKILGIAWFDENKNCIVKTNPRPYIKNLDDIPFPAFDKVDMSFYTTPTNHLIRYILLSGFPIFTSRGCPFKCIFCTARSVFGQRVRYRSPKKVVDELQFLANTYDIDGFYIYDDSFTINKRHVMGICHELISRKVDLIWGCETRPDLITEEIVKKMKEAGCVQIDFGAESGSQKILNILNKGITLQQTKNAINICKKVGVRQLVNFMINTPGETKRDVQMTIKFGRELKADSYLFNITTPFPGSELQRIYAPQLTAEDYTKLNSMTGDFTDYVNFIESKCRFSEHNLDLKKLVFRLWNDFPGGFEFPFLFNKRYIRKICLSKKKKDYLQWTLSETMRLLGRLAEKVITDEHLHVR